VAIFSHEAGVDRAPDHDDLEVPQVGGRGAERVLHPEDHLFLLRGERVDALLHGGQQAGGPREVKGLQLVEMTTAAAPRAIGLLH
jgi:hypothetical protein